MVTGAYGGDRWLRVEMGGYKWSRGLQGLLVVKDGYEWLQLIMVILMGVTGVWGV